MFDRLFQDPHTLARHRDGPLAEERRRFLAHCAERRMCHGALRHVACYTLCVAKALRLAERPGELITRTEIAAAANRWANRRPRPLKKRRTIGFTGHAIRWLKFLGRLQLPAVRQWPFANEVAQFADYLLRERGLSSQTVNYYRNSIRHSLAQIKEAGCSLKTLTPARVDELLAKKVLDEGYARPTIKGRASVLRQFFRFAEERGLCRQGLAAAIMAPRVFAHESLPVGPSWDDVKRLLAAAEGDGPGDIRERALLMLLAVYGLRAGEVTALRLQDFDWEREVLSIPPSKSLRPRTYPLCRPVGDAVLRYLREVRPRSDRQEVFLMRVAPFGPLTSKHLGSIVSRRLRALGLTLPHYGSHVLRHACATHLLAQGLSLKEIGDHLGHQSLRSTGIYAKVDLGALRTVGDFSLEGLL
jgi:integrase/recombinase XerD